MFRMVILSFPIVVPMNWGGVGWGGPGVVESSHTVSAWTPILETPASMSPSAQTHGDLQAATVVLLGRMPFTCHWKHIISLGM